MLLFFQSLNYDVHCGSRGFFLLRTTKAIKPSIKPPSDTHLIKLKYKEKTKMHVTAREKNEEKVWSKLQFFFFLL